MQPWLLELTADAIRVGAADGHTVVLEFLADGFTTRKQQLLAWVKSQNHATHYFVIMKKPSGLQYEREIEGAIRSLRFEIGTDLVPEGCQLF